MALMPAAKHSGVGRLIKHHPPREEGMPCVREAGFKVEERIACCSTAPSKMEDSVPPFFGPVAHKVQHGPRGTALDEFFSYASQMMLHDAPDFGEQAGGSEVSANLNKAQMEMMAQA